MKITTIQRDNLKRILAKQYGVAGADYPYSALTFLLSSGLAEVRVTQAGMDAIGVPGPMTPAQLESWARGFKMADGRGGNSTRVRKKQVSPFKRVFAMVVAEEEEKKRKREHDEWIAREEKRLETLRQRNAAEK